ncbi:MAG: bifunctional adenosylcobinamide kinase/adenosylcobinamide-phosphate guanylyltransferase [Spirochaetia bacterium]|jgi:adenosylcobinamide kinase/adenosylcobinamide-phosphate guanylyltransferase|nr:bifunctional adenosylcobinamide kinase/adenosylcobinamide-phosphate guanylyltransferase [Spirochaetia bacterium]
MRTLITGGVKSGKSSFALSLAEEFSEPRYFLATAEAFDDEMKARIARHKEERAERFTTIEEPLEIAQKLRENIILDCLPLWLNNMFHYGRESSLDKSVDSLIAKLPENIVLVTNEIGMGFIPADPLSRRYGDALGRLNARIATSCDRVILMVAGQPLVVKGSLDSRLGDGNYYKALRDFKLPINAENHHLGADAP